MTSAADLPGATTIRIRDEAAVAPLAARLAAALPARAFIALSGDLGAGKTTLVKAVAAAVGLDPAEVVSPTFGLIHVHAVPPREGGPRRLVHADLYRLSGAADLEEIGWDEATAGPVWVFVEWPERAAAALPPDRLDLTIGIDSETGRTLSFMPRGGFALAGLGATDPATDAV
ncbi:MAG: tRNA ((37)-N6)-threonylcarbamoyltransferase complex ATPase subunit type 1 TsaE [Planctomycetota bacterium]|jgi:tRNA threonylcarbamoyl adenosine modification protein YjeE